MSALDHLQDLPDESTFTSWQDVKQAIQDWAVRDKYASLPFCCIFSINVLTLSSRFNYKTPCKDDRRARYVCKNPACFWRVAANRRKDGAIVVRVTHREHTCNSNVSVAAAAANTDSPTTNNGSRTKPYDLDNDLEIVRSNSQPADPALSPAETNALPRETPKTKRQAVSHVSWLVSAISKVLTVTADTVPADIIHAAAAHYNEKVNYQQAFRCLRLLSAPIKEPGTRERIPDDMRKAIIALRIFLDPPMDFIEIERRTGVKARTAGYIWSTTERKAAGSRDPILLLKCASAQVGGSRGGRTREQRKHDKLVEKRGVHGIFESFPTAQGILSSKLGEPAGPPPIVSYVTPGARGEGMPTSVAYVTPGARGEGMPASVELARAAAELDEEAEDDEMDIDDGEDEPTGEGEINGDERLEDEVNEGRPEEEDMDNDHQDVPAANGPERQLQDESARAAAPVGPTWTATNTAARQRSKMPSMEERLLSALS